MTKIIVTYEDGRIWTCDLEPMGEGDEGEAFASAAAIGISGGELVVAMAVLPWADGKWRSPSGVTDRWTESSAGYVNERGKRVDSKLGSGSAYSQQGMLKERYLSRYMLMTEGELEGAVSVSVDGMLTYVREGGELIPADSVGASISDEGMQADFAVSNRPSSHRAPSHAPRVPRARGVQPELEKRL